MQIFHNHTRTYQALNRKNPAEVAGIKVESKDKRLTVIQNAAGKKPKIIHCILERDRDNSCLWVVLDAVHSLAVF